jgi:two-component system, NarL family, nitrate/nitrite response regulator NarL
MINTCTMPAEPRNHPGSLAIKPPPLPECLTASPDPDMAKSVGRRKRTIRLLVVDDHPVVRKGLSSVLSRHEHLQVVGEAADGREALQKTRELAPSLVLMDIDMPNMNGLTAAELLRKQFPQVKVVILSMHSQVEYVLRIIQSGAHGYVLKDTSTEDLIRAIETVDRGETFYAPEVARVALNQFVQGNGQESPCHNLTNRERDVLVAIADGLSNKEIAFRLHVGVRTIETHREHIMHKLNIHSIAGLTKFAITNGMVSLPKKPEITARS